MIYSSVIYVVASSQCNSPEIESSSTILEVWSLWPPWQQELLENYKNWFSKEIFIFHLNIYSPLIPCPIAPFFFSIHGLKLKTNEFVYDGMICFPLNPNHWHMVLFTGLPTPPRFGFCMHNFWISPIIWISPNYIICRSIFEKKVFLWKTKMVTYTRVSVVKGVAKSHILAFRFHIKSLPYDWMTALPSYLFFTLALHLILGILHVSNVIRQQ